LRYLEEEPGLFVDGNLYRLRDFIETAIIASTHQMDPEYKQTYSSGGLEKKVKLRVLKYFNGRNRSQRT